MSSKNDNETAEHPGDGEAVPASEYTGPERRGKTAGSATVRGEIHFDAKGNPVWQPRTDVPRRRKDDETLDLLKCLDADALSLENDAAADDDDAGAIRPYARDDAS